MNKKVLILLFFVLVFSSCLKGGSRAKMLSLSSDNKDADQRMELILDAIKSKNKDSLKEMFSEEALSETDDIDAGIDYLFEFLEGEDITWKRQKQRVSEKVDYGDKIKEVKTWYYVDTEKQKYLAFLFEYSAYTGHPDKVGLYALRLIKAEDKETQFESSKNMKIPGIYRP